MSNLAQRLITGSIFVVVLVGCIVWNEWSMFTLFLLIAILGQNEFYTLAKKANAEPSRLIGILLGVLLITASLSMSVNMTVFFISGFLIIPVAFTVFLLELWRKKNNPMSNIAWTFLGVIYIALPLALLVRAFAPDYLGEGASYKYKGLLTIFILIWVSDSMAYVCGRLFGKRKLWERISPKKTWEGFIGGLMFCVATGAILGYYWLPQFGPHNQKAWIMWGIIAFVVSVTGMLGDLVESMFKRSIDVKDSGTILPGHGGILDRFDALFLSVPFAITTYWILGAILN